MDHLRRLVDDDVREVALERRACHVDARQPLIRRFFLIHSAISFLSIRRNLTGEHRCRPRRAHNNARFNERRG